MLDFIAADLTHSFGIFMRDSSFTLVQILSLLEGKFILGVIFLSVSKVFEPLQH